MADLAHLLLRTIVRAFYTTDHALVVDALIKHGTLQDNDLAHILHTQVKPLRKVCGRLKEDGLVSVQTRAERKTDGTQSFYAGSNGQPGKERTTNRDWYFINFHRAIDSIKYHMYKLNKHVEKQGAPTTEKKDQSCPQCKSEWTHLETMEYFDPMTGTFLCPRCKHVLDEVPEDDRVHENESMKRLNSQLEKILSLLQQIDATTVPENDFQTALSKHIPINRTDRDPGQQRTEIVADKGMASSKGIDIKPEKIAVQVQDDETVKRESEAAEAQAKREKEARQNALPDWIAKSTVSGDITAVGAKEERLRKEREAHASGAVADDAEERKINAGDADVMAAYWEELAKARAEEAARDKSDEEEEEDDDDEFEDVDVGGGTPLPNGGATANGTGANTPALESSNATDDERPLAKKARVEEPPVATSSNGVKVAEDTPAASDEDEDDLEFENV